MELAEDGVHRGLSGLVPLEIEVILRLPGLVAMVVGVTPRGARSRRSTYTVAPGGVEATSMRATLGASASRRRRASAQSVSGRSRNARYSL